MPTDMGPMECPICKETPCTFRGEGVDKPCQEGCAYCDNHCDAECDNCGNHYCYNDVAHEVSHEGISEGETRLCYKCVPSSDTAKAMT